MVEKIPVRPESVRGLGNIISPAKTLEDFSVFNSSLSYVDGFYTMEYSTTSVRVELTASASSIIVGESLTLTATVSNGGTAVEGASVSFTSGNLAIGTAVTGSDGVATLTVSTLEAGSYSITATYDEVVSSAVTVTVSYGFTSVTVTSDKSILSYADSEAATLTAQLKNGDASASVSGETVEFYKYVDGTNDVLLGSGVTDSNGEALYTYASTGVGDIQVYAKVRTLVSKTYDVQDCLYYDSQTVDKSRYTVTSGGANITYSSNGVTIVGTQATSCLVKNNALTLPNSYSAELTITARSGGSESPVRTYYGGLCFDDCLIDFSSEYMSIYQFSNVSELTSINYGLQVNDVLKIEYENATMKIYINDVLQTTQSITHTGEYYHRSYKPNNTAGRSLTVKDLKIKPL